MSRTKQTTDDGLLGCYYWTQGDVPSGLDRDTSFKLKEVNVSWAFHEHAFITSSKATPDLKIPMTQLMPLC